MKLLLPYFCLLLKTYGISLRPVRDWSKLRFDRGFKLMVNSVWCVYRCICGQCAVENLAGALEHRCCREIAQAAQKLMFDGSIERVSSHNMTISHQ